MGIETRDTTIGATTYRVAHLPTKKGQALLVRIVKLLGPGVGSFVGGLARPADEFDSAMAQGVGEALYDLAARLNAQEVEIVLEEFAKHTFVILTAPDGQEITPRLSDVYDDHFAGRYDDLIKWAKFCFEVNYRSFFAGQSGDSSKPLARLWKILQALPSLSQRLSGTSTASQAVPTTPQA